MLPSSHLASFFVVVLSHVCFQFSFLLLFVWQKQGREMHFRPVFIYPTPLNIFFPFLCLQTDGQTDASDMFKSKFCPVLLLLSCVGRWLACPFRGETKESPEDHRRPCRFPSASLLSIVDDTDVPTGTMSDPFSQLASAGLTAANQTPVHGSDVLVDSHSDCFIASTLMCIHI